jgi:HD-GYP domain-containing protein (c-di-GMP phosphodiesterase class II)
MKFNLNQFLISISFVLDYIEIDILDDITNHGKRVGYTALKMGEQFNMSSEDKFTLLALAIMHDIGGVENKARVSKTELEKAKSHCIIGENSVEKFPFFKGYENVILYHHENYDGSGFFGKKRSEIPLFSQIISIADYFELKYIDDMNRQKLISDIKEQQNKKFSKEIIDKFLSITNNESFWLSLEDNFVLNAIKKESPNYSLNYSYQDIHKITALFSDITDSKSKFTQLHSKRLSEKAEIMADHYGFNNQKKCKFIIAADLHDIGKLAIPNIILDKPGELTKQEYRRVKAHSFYTRKALEKIDGLEEVAKWAGNHHEKNDGSGYPYGLTEEQLDFPSQILVALDIYQALKEERPYRNSMKHGQAMDILNRMAAESKINLEVTRDIDIIFN